MRFLPSVSAPILFRLAPHRLARRVCRRGRTRSARRPRLAACHLPLRAPPVWRFAFILDSLFCWRFFCRIAEKPGDRFALSNDFRQDPAIINLPSLENCGRIVALAQSGVELGRNHRPKRAFRYVEALAMPLMGPIPGGRSFFCPHCGALYSVTDTRRPKSDTEKCVVCLQVMDESDSTRFSAYKLIHRPEDA